MRCRKQAYQIVNKKHFYYMALVTQKKTGFFNRRLVQSFVDLSRPVSLPRLNLIFQRPLSQFVPNPHVTKYSIYMQTQNVNTAIETRERMIAQGMDPIECRDFLKNAVLQQRHNFESVRLMMSPKQRNAMELRILNGEIMLSCISNACLIQSLP